ncbi:hypothetical protein SAMN02745217_00445 [Anaerocolumna xylanovorans DSM 12503]|uniref:Uncharacterized protein n=1 Tax=Anaerocolumna xylanovorans DSM 12503 TaxID=1121345 RepID=A0A1M7XYC6_9FIRM|nr:hypothetical protein SAMN02745217_00445 [Anaerocolumna xylanovorans DSM 12503]
MNTNSSNRIVGAVFLLISCILYSTDKICLTLFVLSTATLGTVLDVDPFNSAVTIGLSVVSLILGVIFLLKKQE